MGKIEGEEGEVIKCYSKMMKKKQKQEKKFETLFLTMLICSFIFLLTSSIIPIMDIHNPQKNLQNKIRHT